MRNKIILAGLFSVGVGLFISSYGQEREMFVSKLADWVSPPSAELVGVVTATSDTSLYLVPTGIHGQQEFRTRPDGVARYFYDSYGVIDSGNRSNDFKLDQKNQRLYFVSYRRGDRIYWTRKAHWVLYAETISAGEASPYVIRQRCGNLLSEWPEQPTEPAADQPTDAELGAESVQAEPSSPELPVPAANPEVLQVQALPDITLPIEEYQPFVATGATGSGNDPQAQQQMLLAGGFGGYPFVGGAFPIIPAVVAGVVTPEPSTWKCLLIFTALFGGIARKYRGEK